MIPRPRTCSHILLRLLHEPLLHQASGAATLEELQRQRDTIERSQRTLEAANGDLTMANGKLKMMDRRTGWLGFLWP